MVLRARWMSTAIVASSARAFQNIDRQCQARMEPGRRRQLGSHQFIISCAQFGRDSLFCVILGIEGWAAVIGLIRRSPDLRWPKADVEGESV
jgi:hypothetical protein